MKTIVQRLAVIAAAALVALSAGAARAATCDLIFEVIPSKDAGPIIGETVQHKLGDKNFVTWQKFTMARIPEVAKFLGTNFPARVKFGQPILGIGGFEGKSSPNVIIGFEFDDKLSLQDRGKAADEIAAAVGYGLIQDGTVVQCKKPLGSYGDPIDTYGVTPGKGFKVHLGEAFVKTVYSTVVRANDVPQIGYTFNGAQMIMLDFGELPGQLKKTNDYFAGLYASQVSIAFLKRPVEYSIYRDNNWAADPKGGALRKHIPTKLEAALSVFRKAYVAAMTELAGGK